METCIFCKIIKGEIPCGKIYEDNDFLVFLDIKPVSNGHLLIIPKGHIVWMQDANDEIISSIFKLSKKMIFTLKKSLDCDYVQVSVVGNEVPHFHVHLIPRYQTDGLTRYSFPTHEYKNSEEKEIIEKITREL